MGEEAKRKAAEEEARKAAEEAARKAAEEEARKAAEEAKKKAAEEEAQKAAEEAARKAAEEDAKNSANTKETCPDTGCSEQWGGWGICLTFRQLVQLMNEVDLEEGARTGLCGGKN